MNVVIGICGSRGKTRITGIPGESFCSSPGLCMDPKKNEKNPEYDNGTDLLFHSSSHDFFLLKIFYQCLGYLVKLPEFHWWLRDNVTGGYVSWMNNAWNYRQNEIDVYNAEIKVLDDWMKKNGCGK
jgi:hypothetical protein